jgi:4-hydroxy-tetrahydrodipicolinate synthase
MNKSKSALLFTAMIGIIVQLNGGSVAPISEERHKENDPFAGVYAASLTPMDAHYHCDNNALTAHCQDLIQRGCQGILLFGTTGEGPAFSVKERKETIHALIENGINPRNLLIGVSFSNLQDAIELARIALEAHCLGILVVPPFFYKQTTEAGVIAYYKALLQEVNDPNLKVILYHIPQFSGVSITLNIIKALSTEFPNQVIGIKESEGNFALTQEILRQLPDFKVFVGNELQLAEAVRLGAAGSICGMANSYPELVCSLYAYGKDSSLPNRQEEIEKKIAAVRAHPVLQAL